MNTDGTGFTLLHTFAAATGDGWSPLGSLTLVGNTLYGMTRQGGGGAGTIFEINTDGTNYNRLHTFTGQFGGDAANSLREPDARWFHPFRHDAHRRLPMPSASFSGSTWTEAAIPSCTLLWVGPMTVRQSRRLNFRRFDLLRDDRRGRCGQLGHDI